MRVYLSIVLIVTAVPVFIWMSPNWFAVRAETLAYTYTVKGKIIDNTGRPVPNVTVALRSPDYDEGDIVYLDSTDQSGKFVVQKRASRSIWNWTLYIADSSRVPTNTAELLDIGSAFCGEYYKSLCGRKVQVVANKVVDLGNIRLEVRHYPLLVRLTDISGNPLINKSGDFDPWWRIRDPLGDIIAEGGNAHVHFRFPQSAVMVALPNGKWSLEIYDDNGSGLGGVFDIQIHASEKPQEVSLKLHKFISSTSFEGRVQYPPSSQMAARRQIESLGFKIDRSSFERRVYLGNDKLIELFLRAGMDPNVLTKNRDVLMMAIMRPKVLKLLLEAGAEVNRRVEDGVRRFSKP